MIFVDCIICKFDITKEFVYLSDTKIIDSNVVIKYGDNIKI